MNCRQTKHVPINQLFHDETHLIQKQPMIMRAVMLATSLQSVTFANNQRKLWKRVKLKIYVYTVKIN